MMKEKLQSALGTFGNVLYWIFRLLISILPVVMIGTPFWASFLIFLICAIIPYLSLPLWIWGFIAAIRGSQDVFAIIYYVATVIVFLPIAISIVLDIIHHIRNKIVKSNDECINIPTIIEPKRNKSNKKAIIVLSVTTVVFLLSTIALSVGFISKTYENNELSAKIYDMEATIEEKDDEISRLDRQALNQRGTISSLQGKLDFYDSYAVCVNDGDPYYHKPNCVYFDSSSFYIYNTATAETYGYTECPYCF